VNAPLIIFTKGKRGQENYYFLFSFFGFYRGKSSFTISLFSFWWMSIKSIQ